MQKELIILVSVSHSALFNNIQDEYGTALAAQSG